MGEQLFQRRVVGRVVACAGRRRPGAADRPRPGAAPACSAALTAGRGVARDGAVVARLALQVGLQLLQLRDCCRRPAGPWRSRLRLGKSLSANRRRPATRPPAPARAPHSLPLANTASKAWIAVALSPARCAAAPRMRSMVSCSCGGLVGHRIGLAHLGQRLLGLAGLEQFAGLLQRLGDFGAQRLRRGQRAGKAATHEPGGPRRAAPDCVSDAADRLCRPVPGVAPKPGRRAEGAAGGVGHKNCSLPTMPILVTPRRCAEARIIATTL